MIMRALGGADTVINVGAGAGAYEPTDLSTFAVEPSSHMIRQRTAATAPVVQAVAEALPFRDDTFDAALALLTLHHWQDWRRGLDEMEKSGGPPRCLHFRAQRRRQLLAHGCLRS